MIDREECRFYHSGVFFTLFAMTFCYDYARPAVTTDIAVFTIQDQRLAVLLIQRGGEPFAGHWALPGGFVEADETLEACALRELAEETGIQGVWLEQLYTFGNPERDPRDRVISVAYFALVPMASLNPRAGSDAQDARWFFIDDLPELAFDHRDILDLAQHRLRAKLDYSTVAFSFMNETFTLGELQTVYEIVRGETLDKRNFRKFVKSLNLVEDAGATRRNGTHKPARLYRLIQPGHLHYIR